MALYDEALRHFQAGRPDAAERSCRRLLAAGPGPADHLHRLGGLAFQAGRSELAAELIARAVALDGAVAAYRSNLGVVLKRLNRLEEAAAAYRAAISLQPDLAEARQNLGNALGDLGRPAEAAAAYRAALALAPAYAEAWHGLGTALNRQDRCEPAVAAYRSARCLRPGDPRLAADLGTALRRLGRLDEAVAAARAAIGLSPDFAEAQANLGNALGELDRPAEAAAACLAAARLKPDFADARCNLANALYALGRLDGAAAAYRAAIALRPDLAAAWSNLGVVLKDQGRFAQAMAAYRTAIGLDPDYPAPRSNLLYILHYQAGITGEAIRTEADRFGERFPATARRFANSPDPDRCLRIGYVSGDLRRHPVGYFLAAVLPHHDRAAVEVTCYANHRQADDLTEALRAASHRWRSLAGLSDDEAAAMVGTDGIDILVDLSGHTDRNRLSLFARRPAPLLVSWLGYWGTTGLAAMDWILSDATTIPPGEERFYRERILRLPGGRFCYAPPAYAPPPFPPPCLAGGPPTFGSFNNLAKVGPEVVRLWAAVLRAVPGARLLLKWRTLAEAATRRRIAEAFAAAGIPAGRLDLRGASPHPAMLADYAALDVALDPLPFSGGLTSCEALWMGVPVVTLPQAIAPSRQTQGFLQALGLTELVATDSEDYVRIAAGLAADPERLAALRRELRPRMAMSPLCDGPAFSARLEDAYRTIWREWCARSRP